MIRHWFSIKQENKSDSEACWSRASGTSAQIPAVFTHRSRRSAPKATSEPVMERVGCSSSRHKTNQPSAIIQCPTALPARALGHTAQPVTNEAATIGVHGRYQGNQANQILLQRADLWKRMTTLFDDMTNENSETEHSLVFKLGPHINFLYFCICRHNESKRRLKNVSLPSVFFFFLWRWDCIFTNGLLTGLGPGFVSGAGPRLRELLVFYMSVSSWDCFGVKPNLNHTIADGSIMRLPEPSSLFSPLLFRHLFLDTFISILHLQFFCHLTWRFFLVFRWTNEHKMGN